MVQCERESPRDGMGEPVMFETIAEPVEPAPAVRPVEAARYTFRFGHERDRQSCGELVGARIDGSGDGFSASFMAVFEGGRDQLGGA